MVLKPRQIAEVDRIFKENGWAKSLKIRASSGLVFDCVCNLLSRLNNLEQSLFLTLLRNYSLFPATKYIPLLEQSLSQISETFLETCSDVFLVPVLSPIDKARQKPKSSTSLLYFAQHTIIPLLPAFQNKKIRSIQNIDALVRDFHHRRKSSLLLFIDDFVGTGNTVCGALNEYRCLCKRNKDRIVVASLVSMEVGLERVRKEVDHAVTARVLRKGITDAPYIQDHVHALEIMKQISSRLAVNETYHLGYEESESLVTMARTPNNTFPVFWRDQTITGEKWPSPFPR